MISCLFKRSMSQSVIARMITNAETAEKRLTELKSKLQELKASKIENKIAELSTENKKLASDVVAAKSKLISLETANGKKQYPVPGMGTFTISTQKLLKENIKDTPTKKSDKNIKDTPTGITQDAVKKVKEAPKKKPAELATDIVIDIRKLDLRIGKIIEINKHPDADSLYVEKVDCGESSPRTVVSGLVKYVPIEKMQNRMVVVLCNLKPVKMRGVTSEAMVMCASAPEKVEVLIPPSGATPGDLVHCEGFPREPESILNPKKKIFETCAPDLTTNNDKVACYKGSPLVVPGKGPLLAPTLKGVSVK